MVLYSVVLWVILYIGVFYMFQGTFKHNLDAKGRLAIPNKIRQLIEKIDNKEILIITQGLENCLLAYPRDEWQTMLEKSKGLALLEDGARDYIRLLIGPATDCILDKMGRIMIPANLRIYANIDKEVIILGAMEKMEIWSKENYEEYLEDFKKSKSERIKQMKDIGL